MPTDKFLNLPSGKRQAILDAMEEEFLKHPYSEIRIGSIIQKAGISRASFYLYFQDKEDLFICMLKRIGVLIEEGLTQNFREEHGIFYNAMKRMFLLLLEDDVGEKSRRLFRKVREDESSSPIAHRLEREFCSGNGRAGYIRACYEIMDKSLYPRMDEAAFRCAVDMGFLIITQALAMRAAGNDTAAGTELVLKQLGILEKGLRA